MKSAIHRSMLLAAAVSCLAAAGCDRAPQAQRNTAPAVADATPDADRSFIGRKAAEAIDKAGEKLRAGNITLGEGVRVSVNGRNYGSNPASRDLPKAELTPAGDLLIAGTQVETTAAQRALLVEHRRRLEGVALAGMAIGVEGADIAGTALTGIGEAVFGGEEGRRAYEARIEAEAGRIKDEARRLCTLLPPLYDSQQALAAALPEFAPYATMTQQDVDECGDAVRDGGTDAGGHTAA
ncbi:hypothetical protein GCM10007164_05890 [Luteimonas padinae]|uniref:DUF2884 family protein n=1 Tax=Luteimonas padinae TaxID=1714359 RepID=A0ABV6SZE5_9GAMM|nr:hypothetical protein [Luteimonas padinae]GHD66719.1 hypothetical protein GCM10007164_05890 [Luteimonas padinae]